MIVPAWNYITAVIILFCVIAFAIYGLWWSSTIPHVPPDPCICNDHCKDRNHV